MCLACTTCSVATPPNSRRWKRNLHLLWNKKLRTTCTECHTEGGGSTIKAPKVLADVGESIAAAAYVDCDFDLVMLWAVFRGDSLELIITVENLYDQPVTTLYEYCRQKKKGKSVVDFKNWRKENVNVTNLFVCGWGVAWIGSSEQKLATLKEEDVEMVDAGGQENSSAKRWLNDMCFKKRWPKPVYREAEHVAELVPPRHSGRPKKQGLQTPQAKRRR